MAIKICEDAFSLLLFGVENWKIAIDFILIAGMSLLGLIIAFLAKSKARFSQKLLIIFFANAFFFLLYYYGYLHRIRILGGIAILFGNGVGFLLGPILYYHLKSIVLPKATFIASLYKSLIPYGVVWILVSVPLAVALAFNTLHTFHEFYLKFEMVLNHVENIYFFVYLVMALQFLKKVRKIYKEHYSTTYKNDLNWYKHLIFGFMVVLSIDTLCTLYEAFFSFDAWNIGTIVAFTLIAMYAYLGYKGKFQSQNHIPDYLLEKMSIPKLEKVVISQNSQPEEPIVQKPKQLDIFSDEEIEQLKNKVLTLLEKDKLHLNEALNLTEMANSVGITNKKLSELLNQHLNTNFYNLINEYRVEEVKQRLRVPGSDKYTLLSIAYDSGFQSKASFNRIFKQKTGHSPAHYRSTLHASDPASQA